MVKCQATYFLLRDLAFHYDYQYLNDIQCLGFRNYQYLNDIVKAAIHKMAVRLIINVTVQKYSNTIPISPIMDATVRHSKSWRLRIAEFYWFSGNGNDSVVCIIFRVLRTRCSFQSRDSIEPFTMTISKEGQDEVCPLLSQSPPVDGNVPELQRLNYRSQTSSRHLRDLHILSSTFLFIFLAYSAAQNLQSTINTDEDLGTTSLAILYLSFSVFSFTATPVVRRFGSKNSVIIGTSGFWLFIAANLYPSWYTMVPASIYVGFGAAIIWVAAGTHLTCAARGHATECNLPEGTVIGNFNGEFWGMCASTQAIGNLFSLFLLKTGKMKAVLTASIVEENKGPSGTTWLFTVFLGSMTLGTILACFLSKQSSTKMEITVKHSFVSHSSLGNLVKAIIVPLLDRRMLLLIPLFAYSGLQQCFVWAEFTKYVISPALGMSGIGGAMAVYGIADTICSLVAGHLTTGLLSISFITSGGMLFQALVLLRLWLKHSFTSGGVDLANMLGMAAIWGVGNGICNTQISALLGILFPHNSETAFSQFRIWQAGAISAALFLSPHITFVTMLAVLAAGALVSLVASLVLPLWVEKAAWVPS